VVVYVMRYDVLSDKREAYAEWVMPAIRRLFSAPGVTGLRAYRIAVGDSQVASAYEFPDFAAWASWYAHEEVQKVIVESRSYIVNLTTELWGPSPLAPDALRPA